MRVVPGGQRLPPVPSEPLKAVDVDVIPLDQEPVACRMPLDQIRVPQPPPQPRHLRLECVGGPARRILPVEPVDQPLGRDHPAHVQKQHGQQRPHMRTAHRHGLSQADLDGPKNAEPHGHDSGVSDAKNGPPLMGSSSVVPLDHGGPR